MVRRYDSVAMQRMHRLDRFVLWLRSRFSECSVRSMRRCFLWQNMANPNWCRPIGTWVRAKSIYHMTTRYPTPDTPTRSTQFWMWTAYWLARLPSTLTPNAQPISKPFTEYEINFHSQVSHALPFRSLALSTWFIVCTECFAHFSIHSFTHTKFHFPFLPYVFSNKVKVVGFSMVQLFI